MMSNKQYLNLQFCDVTGELLWESTPPLSQGMLTFKTEQFGTRRRFLKQKIYRVSHKTRQEQNDLKEFFYLRANLRHLFENQILEVKFQSYQSPNTPSLAIFKLWSAFNITRDTKNFVQISTSLVFFDKIEIGRKFSIISGNMDNTKRQTTFLKSQNQDNFVVIVLRIIRVKGG